MVINQLMSQELEAVTLSGKNLPNELIRLIAEGFSEWEGCFLLTVFKKRLRTVQRALCPDETSVECWVNSLRIDDYLEDDHLAHALLLINAVFQQWRMQYPQHTLIAAASTDEFGAAVKFYVSRTEQSWLNGDTEGFVQPVLVTDSRQLPFQ